MTNNDPPTSDELPKLMSDVAYEHNMFNSAVTRLSAIGELLGYANAGGDKGRQRELGVHWNAWVEVLLLHLRNLTDFYVSEPKMDDVVASHYVTDWTKADGGHDLEWLEETNPSINKRLAHITAYRVRVDKQDDARLIAECYEHVRAVFDVWRARLTPEQLSRFDRHCTWRVLGPT